MRRDIRRHTDRDAASTIDQQVRILRRQDNRLFLGSVVIVLEVDRILVDIGEQIGRLLRHAAFGITHGGWWIIVDRAEIALTVYERHAHREWLGHAHQRVIDRRVTVRVVVTHHRADDICRFLVRLAGRIAALVHRIENAAMNRFQTIPHIR